MNFNEHSDLTGAHAFLSASKYSWVNYDDEKLITAFMNHEAALKGTVLHDFARQCILLGQKLKGTTQTLAAYVNDAIGYRMTPEQVLFYSVNCFGTADAISFRRDFLRIHDLKTGVTRVSFKQLEIYAALFCLEYGIKPQAIQMELRIYQNDDVQIENPDADFIQDLMNQIIHADKCIELFKAQGV